MIYLTLHLKKGEVRLFDLFDLITQTSENTIQIWKHMKKNKHLSK